MTVDARAVDVPASRGLSGAIKPGFTPLSPLNAVRARIVLGAICVLATVLYGWGMGSAGWGNPYYSAAVKSMSASLTNFVFGSFDPLGVITVDKPPMALWPMVASAAVFGYHGWSLLLPQVLEGVAAVFLLHRTVRLWAGEHVALLAALVFAVTPVTVAINRDTNPDTLMVLLLVAAAYAVTRSLVSGEQCRNTVSHSRARRCATGWLLLAAVFLGLGFVTKMLQAWIVVPVFALAYLVGSPAPLRRRLLDVLGAGVVLLASSMWWIALVSFWPGSKPYIGGSTDGSVLNLVIGYNGLGRILGHQAGRELVSGPGMPGGFGGPGRSGGDLGGDAVGGGSGLTRLFGGQVGGQISWLLPLCLLVLIAVAIAGIRQWRSGQASDPARRAAWVLWGGWLLLVGVVLSAAQGGFHSYYTTEMAPAVAAVTAAGMTAMWRHYRRPGGYRWLLLPAAVILTGSWAWVLVSRGISWNGWLRYAVVGAAVVAVVLLIAGRLSVKGTSCAMSRVAGVLAVVTLLGGPAVWSTATAVAASGGAMAQAGPSGSGFGFGFGFGRVDRARGVPAQFRGAMRGDLTAEQNKILAYAQANSGDTRITLAVDGGATAAEAYLIHSDAMIIGMGGFSGQDPVPTVATLTRWVQQGQLRFVLTSGRDSGGRGAGGRGVRSGVSAERIQWVQQHCAVVNPASYGGATPASANAAGPADRSEVLHDCQGRPSVGSSGSVLPGVGGVDR